MIIGCTKKLLDFLGTKPTKLTDDTPALFSWTANLITLNRRKTLIAINNETKCCFVLYGLTAKHLPTLPELFKNGIQQVLRSEYISPEIIEKYLDDCGSETIFTTSTSRSATTYCTKACSRVERFVNLFEGGDMFQKMYLPLINEELLGKDNYVFIHQKLISALQEKYGSPVQSAEVAELEINLDLLTPCKRKLIVPTDINFYQLHMIIQNAFEWHECHLHRFVLKRDRTGSATKIIQQSGYESDPFFFDYDVKNIDETEITVKEVFEKHKKIEYEYDFGDNWSHVIELKRFIGNHPSPYPHCTEIEGEAPMENSGGAEGFDEKLKILNDPSHPDHQWISDWVESTWWKPADIKRINYKIDNCYRIPIPICFD